MRGERQHEFGELPRTKREQRGEVTCPMCASFEEPSRINDLDKEHNAGIRLSQEEFAEEFAE